MDFFIHEYSLRFQDVCKETLGSREERHSGERHSGRRCWARQCPHSEREHLRVWTQANLGSVCLTSLTCFVWLPVPFVGCLRSFFLLVRCVTHSRSDRKLRSLRKCFTQVHFVPTRVTDLVEVLVRRWCTTWTPPHSSP